MNRKMKLSANPCEDFNEFACGHFIEKAKVSKGRLEVSALTILQDENKAILHGK